MNAIQQTAAPSALVPTTMREAMDLAQVMAQAGFLAKELQTPGGAMFVIEQSMRWNMSPFAVAMETSFIQGKPMFSGKIVAAAVVSAGAVSDRLTYDYSGAGDDRTVTVSGTVRGDAAPSTVTVRLRDAKTNNRMWQTQPDQQLAYHGARVWARRHTPWVMLGVMSPEEFDETPREPREVPNLAPAPAPRVVEDAPEYPFLMMNGTETMYSERHWRKALAGALAAIEDAETLEDWKTKRTGLLARIYESGAEELVADAERAIDIRAAELQEARA